MAGLALGMAFAGLAQPVFANEITLNVLYNLPGFTKFHQPLADEFMKKNPDVKINFLAPAAGYNEGQQQVLRSAVTGNLPDGLQPDGGTGAHARTAQPDHRSRPVHSG